MKIGFMFSTLQTTKISHKPVCLHDDETADYQNDIATPVTVSRMPSERKQKQTIINLEYRARKKDLKLWIVEFKAFGV